MAALQSSQAISVLPLLKRTVTSSNMQLAFQNHVIKMPEGELGALVILQVSNASMNYVSSVSLKLLVPALDLALACSPSAKTLSPGTMIVLLLAMIIAHRHP